MAKRDEELQWIMAHLSGNISQEEELHLREWINKSDSNKRLYDEAVKIWESSRVRLVHRNPATEYEWEKLKGLIVTRRNSSRTMDTRIGLSIAASFFLLLFIGFYFYSRSIDEEQSQPLVVTVSTSNEVKTIYLPDSTKLWLNVNSEISYAENFGESDRKVNLKGEGYFIVMPDTTRPFYVEMHEASIVVKGTSFNAKVTDSLVSVVVEEGKVNFINNATKQFVVLTPGERATQSATSIHEARNTDMSFDSWRRRNNPIYDNEVNNPVQFLHQQHADDKNQINQTVIEGTITNTATMAVFKNVALKILYQKPNGKLGVVHLDIPGPIPPGKSVPYRRRLLDIFTKKPAVTVQIERAAVVKQ